MTLPASPTPDRFPLELLAAYADGELGAEDRTRVERWLAAHPAAIKELQTQREFSPANGALWDRAEPPEPSTAAWASVHAGIASALRPSTPSAHGDRWRRPAWVVAGVLAAGVAAALAWIAFTPENPLPERPAPDNRPIARNPSSSGPELGPGPRVVQAVAPRGPIAGYAVLPIATDEDVVLERVPRTRRDWLLVGRDPLPTLVMLATSEEVELVEVAPNDLWPKGMPKMTTEPGDTPMLYATKPR
ncbi:MAG TPA: zf-HC2 domain-containing protein [Gemmata sp.]|nr:zf-HC2 domain-containing protein [Gemmata sp.]